MVKTAGPLSFAVVLAAPVVLLSACAPDERIATQPGTTPAIWTGSPAPESAGGEHHGGGPAAHGAGGGPAAHGVPGHEAPGPNAPASPENTLTVVINGPDGAQVAAATIEFKDDDAFATVTVQTTAPGKLTPGAHGLHIHDVGKCEVNSVAPSGGAPGDFLSAGGHYQGGGQPTHPNHAGDLTSLQVRGDGTGLLVTTTNALDKADLLAGDGTAIIIHGGADNFANIPGDRYRQADGAPAPDATTLANGDSGKRVACGVIGAG